MQVGDKVRILDTPFTESHEVGDIGTIVPSLSDEGFSYTDDGRVLVWVKIIGGSTLPYYINELELINDEL